MTHRAGLEDAPNAYAEFAERRDGYIKVVLKPGGVSDRDGARVA